MSTKEYPVVMIDWEDHTAEAGWVDNVDTVNPVICRSIGWLIKETAKEYKIADCLTQDSGQGGIQCILKNCVIELWELDIK